MSFLGNIFNRKEQAEKSEDYALEEPFEADDENPEEENMLREEDSEHSNGEEDDSEVEYELVEREILPEKIICPDCGGITLEGLDFCDKCGGEL